MVGGGGRKEITFSQSKKEVKEIIFVLKWRVSQYIRELSYSFWYEHSTFEVGSCIIGTECWISGTPTPTFTFRTLFTATRDNFHVPSPVLFVARGTQFSTLVLFQINCIDSCTVGRGRTLIRTPSRNSVLLTILADLPFENIIWTPFPCLIYKDLQFWTYGYAGLYNPYLSRLLWQIFGVMQYWSTFCINNLTYCIDNCGWFFKYECLSSVN